MTPVLTNTDTHPSNHEEAIGDDRWMILAPHTSSDPPISEIEWGESYDFAHQLPSIRLRLDDCYG
jgi:hypothetical protein